MIPYLGSNRQFYRCNSNRNTNVTSEIQRTARGQRAQISDPESGRVTSSSPTGQTGEIGARFICPSARLIKERPGLTRVLSSHWVRSDAARYSSDRQAAALSPPRAAGVRQALPPEPIQRRRSPRPSWPSAFPGRRRPWSAVRSGPRRRHPRRFPCRTAAAGP